MRRMSPLDRWIRQATITEKLIAWQVRLFLLVALIPIILVPIALIGGLCVEGLGLPAPSGDTKAGLWLYGSAGSLILHGATRFALCRGMLRMWLDLSARHQENLAKIHRAARCSPAHYVEG